MAFRNAHQGHDHAHGHHHHDGGSGLRYTIAIVLNIIVVLVQVAIGLGIGSTALLADAGHNLSDVIGLLLAAFAAWLMTRQGSARRTYGFGKAGVLAALANSLLLVLASGALVLEAVTQLLRPPEAAPAGGLVMMVAGGAAIINLLSGWLLAGGHPMDVNRRAAMLHLFADGAVSLGVVLAGALILWTGWRWIDPVTSLLIVAFILASTWGLLLQSLDMALDAAPRDIDVPAVRDWLLGVPGVTGVHDLHIWPLSATDIGLTAHLLVPGGSDDRLLGEVQRGLQRRFGIGHSTIQVEGVHCEQHEMLHD